MPPGTRYSLEVNPNIPRRLARLEELDRLKSNFLATMSHELRTPLTSVIGYAEMMAEGLAGPVSFDQNGNVVGNVYIRRVARKEGRLVNEVVYTYPNVSQFWTYKPEEYLKNPPYTRDYPPAKNLES